MKLKTLFLTLASVTAVSGCSNPTIEYGFALDSDHVMYRNEVAKKDALKREEFELHLASVVDRRDPADRAVVPTGEGKIYEYDPNEFLQGMEVYVKSALSGRLRRVSDGNIKLVVDLEIEKFRTWIRSGTFLSGPYGHYEVDMAVNMIVRDEQSNILLSEHVEYKDSKRRLPYRGHHPSAVADSKEMKKLVVEGIEGLSTKMGWLVHRAFNDQRKYYRPETFERKFETDSEDKNAIPAS